MITREQFLEFFRSDSFHEEMTVDDCREVWLTVLKGSSDITVETLNELLSEYNVCNIQVNNITNL